MADEQKYQIPSLPDDLVPRINELPGDLRLLAELIEHVSPGKGVEAVLLIAKEFRGTYIRCHNLDDLDRKVRDRRIRGRYDRGERVPDIARSEGLSERWVWEILGKAPVDDRQGRLF